LSNQEVFPVATTAENVEYSFNFLAAKPKQGDYLLEFKVVPTNTRFSTIDSAVRKVKVIGSVALENFALSISDSFEDTDLIETQKFTADFGKTLDAIPRAYAGQFLRFSFRVKNTVSGRNVRVHQAFLKFTQEETRHEAIFVAAPTDRDYKLQINLTSASKDYFDSQSGKYKIELLIGDSHIVNPIDWHVANCLLHLGGDSQKLQSHILPEIIHQFRKPEIRPDRSISNMFTVITLSPFLVLFVGLVRVGANVKLFPFSGMDFLYAVAFQGCVGTMLALIVVFWLRLTLMQTLTYLAVLTLPTIFFGQKALSYLAARSNRQ